MTQPQTTQAFIRPCEIRPGDVIRYQIRSFLGPAVVRFTDPIRVTRVTDVGGGAVVVTTDQPIPTNGRRSALIQPATSVMVEGPR